MLTRDLEHTLMNWTVKNSGHDKRRPYIGLSSISDCERVIYDRYRSGTDVGVQHHLLCRISYELEASLIERLTQIGVYGLGEEISLYDGLVRGHTDGVIDGTDVLEIKTVPRTENFPEDRLPRRVYWQVQAYLYGTGRNWAHVVYFARETGEFKLYGVRYNHRMGMEIEQKLMRLVRAVQTKARPACTCGRCSAQ